MQALRGIDNVIEKLQLNQTFEIMLDLLLLYYVVLLRGTSNILRELDAGGKPKHNKNDVHNRQRPKRPKSCLQ